MKVMKNTYQFPASDVVFYPTNTLKPKDIQFTNVWNRKKQQIPENGGEAGIRSKTTLNFLFTDLYCENSYKIF